MNYKQILFLAIVGFLAGLTLSGCTRPSDAERVLRDAGYTQIRIGGYAFFSCSEDDTYATKFEAKSVSGATVTGAVCQGVFKGATIRVD